MKMSKGRATLIRYLNRLLEQYTQLRWDRHILNRTENTEESWMHKHVAQVDDQKWTMFVKLESTGTAKYDVMIGSPKVPFNGNKKRLKRLPLDNEDLLIAMIIDMVRRATRKKVRKMRSVEHKVPTTGGQAHAQGTKPLSDTDS